MCLCVDLFLCLFRAKLCQGDYLETRRPGKNCYHVQAYGGVAGGEYVAMSFVIYIFFEKCFECKNRSILS